MIGMFFGYYLVFHLPGQSWTQTLPAAKNKLKLVDLFDTNQQQRVKGNNLIIDNECLA